MSNVKNCHHRNDSGDVPEEVRDKRDERRGQSMQAFCAASWNVSCRGLRYTHGCKAFASGKRWREHGYTRSRSCASVTRIDLTTVVRIRRASGRNLHLPKTTWPLTELAVVEGPAESCSKRLQRSSGRERAFRPPLTAGLLLPEADGALVSRASAAFSASSCARGRSSMVMTRLGWRKRKDTSFTLTPAALLKASAYAPPCRRYRPIARSIASSERTVSVL